MLNPRILVFPGSHTSTADEGSGDFELKMSFKKEVGQCMYSCINNLCANFSEIITFIKSKEKDSLDSRKAI